MKLKKIALMATSMALVAALAVGGTLAYLTSTDEVKNTFTVGQVKIELNEAPVDTSGKATTGERVKANSYKLMPGHTYDKDPTVTVKAGSEESYVKMTVTVSKAAELDKIFADHQITDLTTVIGNYDSNEWTLNSTSKDTTANTRTYEFWYKETVSAGKDDVVLDDLFETITVPSGITNTELDTIKDMTITVNAYAIQADGFENAGAAWAAYSE